MSDTEETDQTITQDYFRGYEHASREFNIYLNKIKFIFFILLIITIITSVLIIIKYNKEKEELYEYVNAEKEILNEKQRLFDARIDMPLLIFIKSNINNIKVSLYDGRPLVYTNINKSTDICINVPIAEITYEVDLSKTFSEYTTNTSEFFARKLLIGVRLIIKNTNLVITTQIEMLKFYLLYSLNKCFIELQFKNLFLVHEVIIINNKSNVIRLA
ncbi:kinase-like domain-containing protein [Rhizophagus clarus]|uniref:Kinase-like domain-containing protein n=1 Tax=Rhizophagus clarus TaxID=94130 RepID=A0A8H3LD65_9GLOM|nr:kinase-like domain-containing protein [Rhizophagus clarus]